MFIARIALAIAIAIVGVLMFVHALRRHQNWGRFSTAPLPWWLAFMSYRLPREGVSELDIEQEGTVVEGAVGVLLVVLGLALFHFRNG